MQSIYYVGISINADRWSLNILDSNFQIVDKVVEESFSTKTADLEYRIQQFVYSELRKRNSIQSGIDQMPVYRIAVAVDHLFEYGQEFKDTLIAALSSHGQDIVCSIANVTVHSLDAAAYLPLINNGVVITADGCISIAAIGKNGNVISIGERGHMIGDPGSAYWIANKCLRMIYDNADGIELTDYDLTNATKAAYDHFELTTPLDILKPLYSEFSKLKFTTFCDKLATLAQQGDNFCCYLFLDAGVKIGRLLKGLFTNGKHAKDDLKGLIQNGCLHVLGVGRVWNYYSLIREGLFQTLQNELNPELPEQIKRLEIHKFIGDEAYATALWAGTLSIDHASKYSIPDQAKNANIELINVENLQ